MFGFLLRKRRIPLKEQLHRLKQQGIALCSDASIDDLFKFRSREEIEEKPYVEILKALGEDRADGSQKPLSENIWLVDAECIEDASSYVDIVKRMCVLAGGDLPISNIKVVLDPEGSHI